MATWHIQVPSNRGAANLAIKELAKLGQKGRELNKIALYYKDLHMWKTIGTKSHPLKPQWELVRLKRWSRLDFSPVYQTLLKWTEQSPAVKNPPSLTLLLQPVPEPTSPNPVLHSPMHHITWKKKHVAPAKFTTSW